MEVGGTDEGVEREQGPTPSLPQRGATSAGRRFLSPPPRSSPTSSRKLSQPAYDLPQAGSPPPFRPTISRRLPPNGPRWTSSDNIPATSTGPRSGDRWVRPSSALSPPLPLPTKYLPAPTIGPRASPLRGRPQRLDPRAQTRRLRIVALSLSNRRRLVSGLLPRSSRLHARLRTRSRPLEQAGARNWRLYGESLAAGH